MYTNECCVVLHFLMSVYLCHYDMHSLRLYDKHHLIVHTCYCLQSTHVKSKKELFRDQIKRIARSDGGVDGLLAYLDEDEDGLIALSSFMRLLAREKAYIGISESDVESILQPMIGSSGSGRVEGIRVVALLRFMDSKDDNQDEEKSNSEGKSNSDDEEDEEKAEERNEARALTQVVEYDFSSDPETRSLEKKLRGLGKALCKKGMDVEGMFRAVDLRQTGIVRRTDFVEIMSKIGLSILEKGKAMDEAQAQVDGMDSAGDHSEARKNQILQIKRLKGADGGYARTATRAARSIMMNTGSGEYKDKDRGDFKVYKNTPSFSYSHFHSHSHSHFHSHPYISLFTLLLTTLHYTHITHPHFHTYTHTTIGSLGVHGAH